jgi:eukaryotic-like serine/threonine-protein kinase
MKDDSPRDSAAPESPSNIRPSSTFVGRVREGEVMRSAVNSLLARRGGLVMVTGEPGIGKTRLAEETARYATASGARALWGRCWEGGGAPAFWPWIQLIREGVRAFPDQGNAEASSDLVYIDQLVPELRLSSSRVELDRDPAAGLKYENLMRGSERFRLFDAVANLFKRFALNAPLVIVLDDLHAADEDSLMLLRFLARDLKQFPIFVVATYREVDVRLSKEQHSLLSEIGREGSTILLRGLNLDEVEDFIERNSELGLDDAMVSSLYNATDGNPFFLDEMVRLITAESGSDHRPRLDSGLTLPDSVRTIIHRRIAPFADQTKTILAIASLIGREFDLELLGEVSELATGQLIELLEPALANALIAEVTFGFGRYRFVHEVIREALRVEVASTERARLHQRIGAGLEKLHPNHLEPHLAQLAHHYLEAVPLGTATKAVEYARRGAELASSKLAFAEAVRLYGTALRALDAARNRDEVQRCEILLAMGEAQAHGGTLRQARHSFEQAAEIARRLNRSDLLAQAALSLGTWFGGFFNEGRPLVGTIEEALSVMAPSDTPLRAELIAKLAAEHYWTGQREPGLSLCKTAVEMARRVGDPRALVSALWSQCEISWGPENLEGRLAAATEIATLAESIGAYQRALRAHEMRFTALLEMGDTPRVDAEVQAYAALAKKSGEQFGIVERFRAAVALLRGRFDEAERETAELARHAQRRRDPALRACASYLSDVLLREREGIDPAEFEATRRARIARSPTLAAVNRIELAIFLAASARQTEAIAEFESLEENNFAAIPRDWNWLYNMCGLAVLCLALQDRRRSAIIYGLLLPYADRNLTAGWGDFAYGCVSRFLGMLAGIIDKPEDAERHFEYALQFDERMGARPWATYTRYEYARMLFTRDREGDREHALTLLEAALEAATTIGMKPLERRVNSLIAKISPPQTRAVTASSSSQVPAGVSGESQRIVATILFLDIVSSTEHVTKLRDRRWVELRRSFFELIRKQLAAFNGREIATAGDGMLAIFDRPAAAIHCAFAMSQGVEKLGLQMRAGIHTGECELVGGDVIGIAVHIGARVASQAAAAEVLVSSTVRDLLAGGDIRFVDRGSYVLKGVAGEWHLFAAQEPE